MPYKEDIEVGILISTNCPRAIKPREVIPGLDDDPYGFQPLCIMAKKTSPGLKNTSLAGLSLVVFVQTTRRMIQTVSQSTRSDDSE